jgi:hypothetical protein
MELEVWRFFVFIALYDHLGSYAPHLCVLKSEQIGARAERAFVPESYISLEEILRASDGQVSLHFY